MADYEGMYVSYDVRLIWDCYAEKTETDKYDNTTTTGYQYMVMQYNEDYDGISGRFVSVFLELILLKRMQAFMIKSWRKL